MCQDETRVGLKTLTGKVITASGVKPTVKVIWPRDNFWIYGAIEPLTGDHFLYEYPKLDGECFQQFLDWLSVQLGSDYAILQIDQAPAHTSSAISWQEFIIPLFQPPSAPELNQERKALASSQETSQKSTFLFFTSFTRKHPRDIRPTYF
ncbi:MAG TPA: transposase [Nostoc sp.]|uniref:transposase n=1 Tax=Nostoc sp. TaxID=1180 RepID=UPI002D344534|nr:transposase [Nostoc sp.]HYX17725.1 transposase [Nostoc sp.]